MIETLIVALLIGASALFVVRRAIAVIRSAHAPKAGCGGCGTCETKTDAPPVASELVQLRRRPGATRPPLVR